MKPKKHLGQNFLKKESIVRDFVRAAKINIDDIVIEVGPGKGAITALLLQSAKKVIAVEKDAELVSYLTEKFAKEIVKKKLFLVNDDILKFNPENWKLKIARPEQLVLSEVEGSRKEKWKLIGAIPYYITGLFLKRFLSINPQPKTIALIIQKEVAERIVARDGKESILSLSVKAYGTPYYIKAIPANAFYPTPKIDSAIMIIEDISKQFFNSLNLPTLNVGKFPCQRIQPENAYLLTSDVRVLEKEFFTLIRAGFSSKRKKLISNLKKIFPQANFEEIFSDLKIDENIRAENLTLGEWKKVFLAINPHR